MNEEAREAHEGLRRRDVLRMGGAGLLGLAMNQFFSPGEAQADPHSSAKKAKAKSVIHIFLPGGMAAQESFDPKPYAPIEYRGELKAIKTSVGGLLFSELFKDTAKIAHKLTVCRAMTHGEADHSRGTHNMFTGYRPSPALLYPSIGSVVAKHYGPRRDLPPYVCVPNQPNNFAGSGYLSAAYAPFSLGGDPAKKDFKVRDLDLPGGVKDARLARRRALLETVNKAFKGKVEAEGIVAMDSFYERAYGLIASKKAREAFNLRAEPKKIRSEYGENAAGLRMLMARRLVEAGVRYVSMTYGAWDMHDGITASMKRTAPPLDKAFATLIRDLDRRGLLKSTLVLVSSEFGRTPKINGTGGRDHWPKVFSVVMAGGGLKQGLVYGSTDPTAVEPNEDALTVEDWATTVYNLVGIDANKKLLAPGGRPIAIVNDGKVRTALLA